MRSPFRYPGGKSQALKFILLLVPPGMVEYREPCVGGGSVFFAVRDRFKKAWINDVHAGLMATYHGMSAYPETLIKLCRAIPPCTGRKDPLYQQHKERLQSLVNTYKDPAVVDPALRYFFLNRVLWAGRVTYSSLKARLWCCSNPEGWSPGAIKHLEETCPAMVGVKTSVGDFEQLLDNAGVRVWVYLDPPYFRDTQLTKPDKQYECGFSLADHERLMRAVIRCKHRVCLSYDGHPEVEHWAKFHRLRIERPQWNYCGSNLKVKQTGNELLILNC